MTLFNLILNNFLIFASDVSTVHNLTSLAQFDNGVSIMAEPPIFKIENR